eukprot:COSAG02_NODE_5743_length_4073_cov_47.272771_1_plen_66_part_00
MAGALVRPVASSCQPCLPSSFLGDFITRLTPRSLVTLPDLVGARAWSHASLYINFVLKTYIHVYP